MRAEGTVRKNGERGFTLIEVLIVVAIIGLLTATAVPVYRDAQAKAQRAALAGDMKELYSAFMRYHVDRGGFPSDSGAGAFNITTLNPLANSGYFPSVDGLKSKTYDNRMYWYWAPDWEGPNSDFIVIARSKVDPNVWVYAMHYDLLGLFAYDGVYLLLDGQLVRADGRAV
jgi:prepilin-type N-terminal cleavage/methylation domain-containing protein